jgi:mitochondrial fission protein ELM1
MNVDELKQALTTLSAEEQNEVSAFLFSLRRRTDAAYQAILENRLSDKDSSHWLTPEEFEKRLDQK